MWLHICSELEIPRKESFMLKKQLKCIEFLWKEKNLSLPLKQSLRLNRLKTN